MVADVNEKAGRALAGELDGARFVPTDVTNPEQVEAAVRRTAEEFGQVNVTLNCAGIVWATRIVGRDGPHELSLFERVVSVNLIGTFNVVRLAAMAMKENEPDEDGQRGVIINTASIAAFEGQIGQAAYAASKGGVASLTLPAARELARFGIRVAAIAPGAFDTPMMNSTSEDVRQALVEQIPFPSRFGQADEYAALAEHIVENHLLNGCVIRLDGALRMGPK